MRVQADQLVICYFAVTFTENDTSMSLLNQKNQKDKKNKDKKGGTATAASSKFIQKPKSSGFVSKQQNTGSQRGS
ncbi:hypothetical protein LL912_02230 [Niabella sp. CC-SYL272]|uniref:hypothetical protein n=1 Tax=Niabella agricola TaxID=2891571 RepID=UPI001F32B988|nr:hypothetical protein [Niabella agricola]MCF3107587.1 hypothetical protein [Niabella agricola]